MAEAQVRSGAPAAACRRWGAHAGRSHLTAAVDMPDLWLPAGAQARQRLARCRCLGAMGVAIGGLPGELISDLDVAGGFGAAARIQQLPRRNLPGRLEP